MKTGSNRMRWQVVTISVLTLILTGSLPAKDGKGGGRHQHASASDEFFTNAPIPRIKIEIPKDAWDALNRDNRQYVRATVREGDRVYRDVAIHLKGAAGSTRPLNDRPALTLNFDKFTPDQNFHGLDKVHLNNSVQDPSYLTELLCGEMFRAAGVPAPRVTHARVELNGQDFGLYVLIEGFDKTFLKRYFKDTSGNLYDGGFLRDVTEPLQRLSGTGPDDHKDLQALAAACNEPDAAKRLAALEKILEVDTFLTMIALDILMEDWDGYALNRNNYKLYHDPTTGRFTFFPHGLDQMFERPDEITPNFGGLVASSFMKTPGAKLRYRERLATLFTNVYRLEVLTNRIDALHQRIRPVIAAIHKDQAANFDGAVAQKRDQVIRRAASIARQLSVPVAKALPFDSNGVAMLKQWRPIEKITHAEVAQATEPDGRKVLKVTAAGDGPCTASWRLRVLLEGGHYHFEGLARVQGVVALAKQKETDQADKKGEGAGIRIHGTEKPRPNKLLGDAGWTKLEYDFDVPMPSEEVELLCELRATAGSAWFDVNSLRLVRKKE